jgi:short-subunit dehydrogenase
MTASPGASNEIVLITGASAGLGEGFARSFAAARRHVALVARRGDRLEALAKELSAAHGVHALPLVFDLRDPAAPGALVAELERRGYAVDLLVNNAGFGARGEFASVDRERQLGMIDLNVRSLVDLTHRVLPGMIARRRGGILNVASTAAFQPGPYMAVYYATKAFVLSWSEALHEEVKPHGVHVSALCPGPTDTEFGEVAGMKDAPLFRMFASGAESVVRDGIAGVRRNAAVNVSGVVNALMAHSIRVSPRFLARRLAGELQKKR